MGVWTRAIQVDSSSEFIKCATCFLKAAIMAAFKKNNPPHPHRVCVGVGVGLGMRARVECVPTTV